MFLSNNLNDLITLIDSLNLKGDILQARLVFATVYIALLVDKIEPGKAVFILEHFRWQDHFTDYESGEITYLIALWNDLQEMPTLNYSYRQMSD